MEIKKQVSGKTLILSPEGRMDSVNSTEFAEYLDKNFTDEYDTLVIDFAEVDFISSKALRVLVTIYKALEGRKMIFRNVNSSVYEILRITGMLKTFTIEQ